MVLDGRHVLVVGLGRSGRAAAELCLRRGARVTLTDNRQAEQIGDVIAGLAPRCALEFGGHRTETFTQADLIVLSPGVPPIAPLQAARRAGVPVIGEVELASRFVASTVVGITGTNGKSTTTALAGALVAASGKQVFCGGNLGQPLSEVVGQPGTRAGDVAVLELSSFQLETVQTFHAHVAVLLNVSEDHLDRYESYAQYQQAKARLFERQTAADHAIVPGGTDQAHARQLAANTEARRLLFGVDGGADLAAWRAGPDLCIQLPGEAQPERYRRDRLRLPGQHNVLNGLAALLAARLAGASRGGCARALAAFEGLPHRMQLVGEHRGVRYYNDSKATNVGAVVGSLAGFERPVVLIAGGKDKGGDYAPLRELVQATCRHVILIGEAADRIARALGDTVPVHRESSLPAAVAGSMALARSGDAVVLSPACSSFDMFDNYEQRGRVFSAEVRALL